MLADHARSRASEGDKDAVRALRGFMEGARDGVMPPGRDGDPLEFTDDYGPIEDGTDDEEEDAPLPPPPPAAVAAANATAEAVGTVVRRMRPEDVFELEPLDEDEDAGGWGEAELRDAAFLVAGVPGRRAADVMAIVERVAGALCARAGDRGDGEELWSRPRMERIKAAAVATGMPPAARHRAVERIRGFLAP